MISPLTNNAKHRLEWLVMSTSDELLCSFFERSKRALLGKGLVMKITNVVGIYDNDEFVTIVLKTGSVVHLPRDVDGFGHSIVIEEDGVVEVGLGQGDPIDD